MCRFYGWSDEYVESLPVNVFTEYWQAITVIEARQRLVDMNLLLMPNADDKTRSKFYKELERQAYPLRKSESKKLSNKELMELLSRR